MHLELIATTVLLMPYCHFTSHIMTVISKQFQICGISVTIFPRQKVSNRAYIKKCCVNSILRNVVTLPWKHKRSYVTMET